MKVLISELITNYLKNIYIVKIGNKMAMTPNKTVLNRKQYHTAAQHKNIFYFVHVKLSQYRLFKTSIQYEDKKNILNTSFDIMAKRGGKNG